MLRLTKHHGLGNDFLVALDELNGRALDLDTDLVRQLCDRRRGIGADGLIHGASAADDGFDTLMRLRNADGSEAEMSGNGIRCLAQALARARNQPAGRFCIGTAAGARHVDVRAGSRPETAEVRVTMGAARPGPALPAPLEEELSGRHLTVDMGNPHLVIEVDDPRTVDLATEGAWLEQQFPGGVNLEFVSRLTNEPDVIVMSVWERGAGITEACGTGACAAAHAARSWGLVGDRVRVDMPGGSAQVDLADDDIALTGPAVYVATIEVEA